MELLFMSRDESLNFSVAKSIAILVVVTGHYFGGIWWIPVTVALFVFAFSSAFFTTRKYSSNFNASKYWKAKVSRLAIRLSAINLFLFILFLLQNKPGIFTWQTLITLTGLSGFITWFNLPAPSPFGRGMWFFTLLLIFYVTFPILLSSAKSKRSSHIFIALSLALISLEYLQPMGHMLWLTTLAFLFGVYHASHYAPSKFTLSTVSLILACTLLITANFVFHTKLFNIALILIISVFSIRFTLSFPFSTMLCKIPSLEPLMLEIYLIHPYLLLRNDNITPFITFPLSLLSIITTSYLINRTTLVLTEKVMSLLGNGNRLRQNK